MRKLLSANFSRLWKSRVFWLISAACFAIGALAYALAAVNAHRLGPGWLAFNAHALFYLPVLYIAAVLAIFACFYIGPEHADGTLRNKLIVGHSRTGIYLSYFLTTVLAALLFVAASFLALLVVGLPLSGSAVLSCVDLQPWRMMNAALVVAEYAAMFALLAVLDGKMARNLVIGLLMAVAVTLIGRMLYERCVEPAFVTRAVLLPDGSTQLMQGEANGSYLSGPIRSIVEWLTLILPSGSVMLSVDKNFGFDWREPVLSALLIAALNAVGIGLFKKKDVR